MAGGSEDEYNVDVHTKLPATPSITGNISTVPDPYVSPTMPTIVLLEAKIGLPANPEQNLNLIVDYMLHDEG